MEEGEGSKHTYKQKQVRKQTVGRELEESNWRKEKWRKGTVGRELWEGNWTKGIG